jgi:hypothetical protein
VLPATITKVAKDVILAGAQIVDRVLKGLDAVGRS